MSGPFLKVNSQTHRTTHHKYGISRVNAPERRGTTGGNARKRHDKGLITAWCGESGQNLATPVPTVSGLVAPAAVLRYPLVRSALRRLSLPGPVFNLLFNHMSILNAPFYD